MKKNLSYFLVYVSDVDRKTNFVHEGKPTKIAFKNEEDAKVFCDKRIKVDKLYYYKKIELDYFTTLEKTEDYTPTASL